MRGAILFHIFLGILAWLCDSYVKADDPSRFLTFVVEYGEIAPLGVRQRGILINGQFPGPTISCVTNDNVIINVINNLDEPFLITWHGVKQRKGSWEDGVLGTNCPIPPNTNWTYKMQMKDQIGTYNYYPSTLMHRAAGGFGGLNILRRPLIPIPYPTPYGEFTLIINDWWNKDNKVLQQILDSGETFPHPDGLLINGLPKSTTFTGTKGQNYLIRVSNLCLVSSINFRIQGHTLILVEVEGSHTLQESYESLDIHPGQSAAFLLALNATVKDYVIIASSRFTKPLLNATATLRYEGSNTPASGLWPPAPPAYHWSMRQAREIRWNLTANAARPNPQGSYHYGTIPIVRTIVIANSPALINGKERYALNSVSYVNPSTPLKLADYFNIPGVFVLNATKDYPTGSPAVLGVSVFGFSLHDYVELVFQNNENTLQSYHLDGYDFWTVAFADGQWNTSMRKIYNMEDATTRNTVQVYPNAWTAILISMDNKGMWNLRSAIWPRRYLGQEAYMRVWNIERSLYTEYDIPDNAILCGKAKQ
ncbi:hypothetical protein ACH5RR_011392 [Cinchona calisaya]|uniref:L-ascorbate oxidase n=1 Tax=Cinchona calisaya TaxID=153742 RepID=A0ABD3A791_9GENT